VIATGRQYSVKEFVARAAAHLGMHVAWQAEGLHEQGIDTVSGRCIVAVNPRYFRPTEVEMLLGDPGKAREKLGWVAKTSFDQLVEEMVVEDLKLAERDDMVIAAGYRAYSYHE
jgi:GDPmannose 4,6-dehydratase